MNDRDSAATSLAARIADGSAIDWAAAESAAGPCDPALVEELRAIAGIATVHRAPATATDQDARAGATWGPLTILEPLGTGRFGDVYLAWDARLQRRVALKLLRAASSSLAAPTRAIDEARLLARVRHPNVLTVHGAEYLDDQVGIWTEFVEGQTLEARLAEHGPLDADEVIAIGVDLCRALAAVHDAGLLHRDIKAQNVMRETGGRIVLMDFGAGHDLAIAPVRDGDLTGTPLYLAPEVLAGGAASPASDVYALGVLLFHLLTGTHPVTGATLEDVRAGHAASARQRLRDLRPELLPDLTAVLERAMAHEPGGRLSDAAAFADALEGTSPRRAAHATPAPAGSRRRVVRVGIAALGIIAVAAAAWLTTRGRAFSVTQLDIPDAPNPDFGQGSRDGRYLPYSAPGRLMLHDFVSGEQRVLASGGRFSAPVMSADGTTVAFAWDSERGSEPSPEIRLIDTKGATAAPRSLLRGPRSRPTGWLPDGSAVLVLRERSANTYDLVLVSVANGAIRTLKERLEFPGLVSLSHDGRFVAYDRPVTADNDARDIVVLAVESLQEIGLVSHPADDADPLWTPDDRGVLFTSDRSGTSDVWLAPVSDARPVGHLSLVLSRTGSPGSLRPLALADDGTLLYALTLDPMVGAYTAALESDGTVASDSRRPVAASLAAGNVDPDWSPDGRSLAFVSIRRTGGPRKNALVIRSRDDGKERVLWPELMQFSEPLWSPDGRWLVARGLDRHSNSGPWLIDAATGAVTRSARGPYFPSMDWAPDSRSLFVVPERAGTVSRFDVTSGRLEDVYGDPGGRRASSVRLSPDHQRLAIMLDGKGTRILRVLSLSDGTTRDVLSLPPPDPPDLPGPVHLEGWTADGASILFVRGKDWDELSLWSVPAAGGPPRPLNLSGPMLWNVRVSPDGNYIAYRMGSPGATFWLMRNFLPAVGGR